MGGIEAALAEHAFEHLFVECLGWDRFRSTVTVGHGAAPLELTGVAQKRGVAVFVCPAHRTVLANRARLRAVQRQIRRSHHEHILIYFCETPRKQVWQWATAIADGRRILHREHPFFSNAPPPRLLERMQGLSIGLEEEEQTTLLDVVGRVRTALLPHSDLNLFTKRPSYAAESDRLAMAMKRGEPGAFGRFVEFHMPLARHFSRMLVRWFDVDRDDAEQTAMIGLLEAARRFDPDRGYQFSTYAGYWIRRACQRYGLQCGLTIRIPPRVFWPCYRLLFRRARLIAAHGRRAAEACFERELEAAGVSRVQWALFCQSRRVKLFSDVDRRVNLDSRGDTTIVSDALGELHDEVARGLTRLLPRQAEIVRLRYGIGDREHTLEEVAQKLRITRERVRQIQVIAEEKLRFHIRWKSLFSGAEQSGDPTRGDTAEQTTA